MGDASCAACDLLAGGHAVPGGIVWREGGLALHALDGPSPLPGWLVLTAERHARALYDLDAAATAVLGPLVQRYDHWLAFVLLGGIGAKMLHEARSAGDDEAPSASDHFRIDVLLVLALATSIDALAVGVTLPIIGAPLVLSLVTIGVTTALLSGLGVIVGRRFGASLGKRLDVAGGLMLIGLGTKILIEHLNAG